jgi:hypothetical protein
MLKLRLYKAATTAAVLIATAEALGAGRKWS